MAEVRFPTDWSPATAPSWFQTWSQCRADPQLNVTFVGSQRHASAVVLFAAGLADRQAKGLGANCGFDEAHNPWFEEVARLYMNRVSSLSTPAREQVFGALSTHKLVRMAAEASVDAIEASADRIGASVVRMHRFVFEELGANIVDHSAAPSTGFGWVEVDSKQQRIELAFADAGVGVLTSLQRNPELQGRVADDGEALLLAIKGGVSGLGSSRSNMGIGLKVLVDFSDSLDGDLYIASGSAMLVRKTVAGERATTVRSIPPWQGVWICLDAPLP